MYELITKDEWEFSVDIEKTKEYYRTYSDLCNCDGCKNFYQAIRSYSPELTTFLEQFGIDVEKPIKTERFAVDTQSKTIDYAVYYVVHGTAAARNGYEIDLGTINVVVQPPKNSPSTEIPEPYFVFQVFDLFLPWVLTDNVEEIEHALKKKRYVKNDQSIISKYLEIAGFLLWAVPSTLAILIYSSVLNKAETLPYLYICLGFAQILNGIQSLMDDHRKRSILFFIIGVLTFIIYFIIL